MRAEIAARARGELGWSAEWRKDALAAGGRRRADAALAGVLLREFLRHSGVAVLRHGAARGVHAGGTLATRTASLVCGGSGAAHFVDIIEAGINLCTHRASSLFSPPRLWLRVF